MRWHHVLIPAALFFFTLVSFAAPRTLPADFVEDGSKEEVTAALTEEILTESLALTKGAYFHWMPITARINSTGWVTTFVPKCLTQRGTSAVPRWKWFGWILGSDRQPRGLTFALPAWQVKFQPQGTPHYTVNRLPDLLVEVVVKDDRVSIFYGSVLPWHTARMRPCDEKS